MSRTILRSSRTSLRHESDLMKNLIKVSKGNVRQDNLWGFFGMKKFMKDQNVLIGIGKN